MQYVNTDSSNGKNIIQTMPLLFIHVKIMIKYFTEMIHIGCQYCEHWDKRLEFVTFFPEQRHNWRNSWDAGQNNYCSHDVRFNDGQTSVMNHFYLMLLLFKLSYLFSDHPKNKYCGLWNDFHFIFEKSWIFPSQNKFYSNSKFIYNLFTSTFALVSN